jgi:60 kDa SS-A/Ro ribonucleoprotein
MVSDNESWAQYHSSGWRCTAMNGEWREFKKRNPNAKLVLIDIDPSRTTQLADDKSVLNVGGFSDQVFNVVDSFMKGDGHWVDQIEKTEL